MSDERLESIREFLSCEPMSGGDIDAQFTHRDACELLAEVDRLRAEARRWDDDDSKETQYINDLADARFERQRANEEAAPDPEPQEDDDGTHGS